MKGEKDNTETLAEIETKDVECIWWTCYRVIVKLYFVVSVELNPPPLFMCV